MPANITLKNIPDAIYQRIKVSAARNHRSLNSEIIACLERQLAPATIDVEARVQRAAELRARVRGGSIEPAAIAAAIDRDHR